jgi:hypothetical protein
MGEGKRLLPVTTGIYRLLAWCNEQLLNTHPQSVFLDKSLPIEVRYLAVIQLKNGIDKYWRKTATKYDPPPRLDEDAN